MSYTTVIELNERFGLQLMIELASQAVGSMVDEDVFEAVVLSQDLSAFTPADIAIANKLLVAINKAIDRVTKEIDSYISGRNPLPLSQLDIDDSVIPQHAENIVRYSLMLQGADETTSERHSAAIKWLKDVSNGSAVIKNSNIKTETGFNVSTTQGQSSTNWSAY